MHEIKIILLQNIFNIFIIAIIIEAAISGLFSLKALNDVSSSRAFEATRDAIIIILSLFLCYQVDTFRIFAGTGIKIPFIAHIVISGLVLARLVNFVKDLAARFKGE